MTGWRTFALALGALVAIGGAWLWLSGGVVMVFVFGVLLMITAALEPVYGRASGRPRDSRFRRTGECFVDPETGGPVSVWFDPASGERRYVDDSIPPAS